MDEGREREAGGGVTRALPQGHVSDLPLIPLTLVTPPSDHLSGLTKAKQQPEFRSTHPVAVKKNDPTHRPSPALPSDRYV